MRENVLIVGSGAREHALAWKLSQSPQVDRIFAAPGNAGMHGVFHTIPVAVTDIAALARLTEAQDIGLTIIGPEAPLALGLADRIRALGRLVVGPGAAAARLESSKSFGKDVMVRAGVPTANYRVFETAADALHAVRNATYPFVVKADGLAAGKGVSMCAHHTDAESAITSAMVDRRHGAAGDRIIIEEALSGREVSLLALVAGDRIIPFPMAQDHKRLGDGDTGPNTGGMGAYAPVPFVTASERDVLVRELLEPVVAELHAMGMPYNGVLFAGVMLSADGPRVLEFNCRLGDPETQVIMPLLAEDLYPWLSATARAASGHSAATVDLPGDAMVVRPGSTVGVVLAAPGYPEAPRPGSEIYGLAEKRDDVLVFHAGTAISGKGRVVTAGGRVLTVVGMGTTIDDAAQQAYAAPVWFEGMQRRTDIGWQVRAASVVPAGNDPILVPESPGNPSTHASREYDAKPRLGVLASGNGTNLQSLIDACAAGDIEARVSLVISNNPTSRALDRAEKAGIPTAIVALTDHKDPLARQHFERQLLAILNSHDLDLGILAGWMVVLSQDLLAASPCRFINIHPALLPVAGGSFDAGSAQEDGRFIGHPVLRGARAVREAVSRRLTFTGVSIHFVTPLVDAGPVIVREMVPIHPGDDETSLYARIKPVEHRLLREAIQNVLQPVHPIGGSYARN